MWQVKTFKQLTVEEFYQILYLRTKIFVVEQDRVYQEVDQIDPQALHLFKTAPSGEVVAYARIFLSDDGQKVVFGRVATSKAVRGQGVGRELLEEIMKVIGDHYPELPVEIEAQIQVQGYYERANFRAVGDQFIFNHTPHIKMVHAPLKAEG